MAFVELPPINLRTILRQHPRLVNGSSGKSVESEYVPLLIEQEDGSTSFKEGVGGGETGETTSNDDRAVVAHVKLIVC